jgi:hypothetical protein
VTFQCCAVVDLYDANGGVPTTPADIEAAVGFDEQPVQRALRALDSPPSFFENVEKDWGGSVIMIGRPTANAFRVSGAWPSPEQLLQRLIAALENAADDKERTPDEQSKFRQAASWLGSFASQVAIGALGSAGGNLLS